MDGHVLEPRVHHEAEQQAERAYDKAAHEERAAGDSQEIDLTQIGDDEVRFATAMLLRGGRGGQRWNGEHRKARETTEHVLHQISRVWEGQKKSPS